jgi:hypothetical protein
MGMRIALLLIIMLETLWIGQSLGIIADHYDYLTEVYTSSLSRCDEALERTADKLKETCK